MGPAEWKYMECMCSYNRVLGVDQALRPAFSETIEAVKKDVAEDLQCVQHGYGHQTAALISNESTSNR